MMVFTILPGLEFLSGAYDWFCDGTFSTAPIVIVQIYPIHASIDGVLLSLLSLVVNCFEIDFAIRATNDFEIANKNAFSS